MPRNATLSAGDNPRNAAFINYWLGPQTAGSDVTVRISDATGNVVWNKVYGGNEYDWGSSGRPTPDGGFVVAGWTRSFGAGSNDCARSRADTRS